MDSQKTKSILDKYRDGSISDQERVRLENWYLTFQEEGEDYTDKDLLEDASRVELYLRKEFGHQKRQKPNRLSWSVAATLLLAGIGFVFYFYSSNQKESILQYDTSHILPVGNRAQLVLEDGKVIDLSSEKESIVMGSDMIGYDDGTSVLSGSDVPSMLTLVTPKGGHYQVVLPDGTKVWLNAASTLRYPSRFVGTERRVELIGEGYFEVAPIRGKENSRFIVSSPKQKVTVLGTHFNIMAYEDDRSSKTTLLEGEVLVQDHGQINQLLKPGQMAVLSAGAMDIRSVDPENATAWKDGSFNFDDEPLEEIMRKLSRWYDVEIEYRGVNKQDRFGGSFYRSDHIGKVLRKLELTGRLHFKIEGRRVIVMN